MYQLLMFRFVWGVQVFWCTGVLVFWCTGVQLYSFTWVQVYSCTDVQVYRCTVPLIFNFTLKTGWTDFPASEYFKMGANWYESIYSFNYNNNNNNNNKKNNNKIISRSGISMKSTSQINMHRSLFDMNSITSVYLCHSWCSDLNINPCACNKHNKHL